MRLYVFLLACSTLPASAANVDGILAANRSAMGGDNWNGKAAVIETYAFRGQGLTGETDSSFDLSDGRFVDSFRLGVVSGANGFDGQHSWAKDPSGTVTSQDGGSSEPLSFNEAYRNANLWWQPDRGGAAIVLEPQKNDATADALSVTPKSGKQFDAWFDRKTHLLVKTFEQQGSSPLRTTISDYRPIDGVLIAGRIHGSTGGDSKYDQDQTLLSARFMPRQSEIVYAQPKNSVTDFAFSGGVHEAVLPFRLLNNHIYADVKVNGKGPYTFIFDTGGANIVTPGLAKQLGLKIEGHVEARGAGSGTMDAGFTHVSELSLGAATMKDQAFGAFPLEALSDIEGVDEIGMIGFETFRRFVTRIDYGRGTLTLIDPQSFDPKDAGTPIPLSFDGNVAEIHARYDGVEGIFQLDTGARSSLTLTAPFVASHGLHRLAKGIEGVTGWGVGGPTRSFAERGGTLEFGSIKIDSPVVELSTDKGGAMAEADTAGNIGAGILKRFIVTLDYEHKTAYLKPVEMPVADLDTFDRAGVWLNRDPKGFKVIDVTAAAPAAEAGLKAGDVVTAVDGKPATSIQLSDLRFRFRNDMPGTHVRVTILRDGKVSDIDFVLRDLV